jgi:DNA-binding NarL/FixJ family response regulator
MRSYRIVLADDHRLLRQGLRRILNEKKDLVIVGEVGDGLELINLLKKSPTDMVIIDIAMPNLRGIEAIHEINRMYPDLKVLVLTMHNDKEYLYRAMSAGAHGYLLKEDADEELFSAIEKIQQGKIYVSPSLAKEVMDDLIQKRPPTTKQELLSTREREVLKLIAEGKSNRDIAALLTISVRTVENHRANIMRKLNMKKTADLVRYALDKGYL